MIVMVGETGQHQELLVRHPGNPMEGGGGGGGGQVRARPVAVLEVTAEGTRVEPIVDVSPDRPGRDRPRRLVDVLGVGDDPDGGPRTGQIVASAGSPTSILALRAA